MTALIKANKAHPQLPTYIKAVQAKWFAYFCAYKAKECCDGTADSKLRATCLWAYAEATHLMENSPRVFFSEASAKQWAWLIRVHLLTWQSLSRSAKAQSLRLWRLIPKTHCLDHMQEHVLKTQRNPMGHACFQDEDFLGKLKKVGLKCHGKSICKELVRRYQLGTAIRWKRKRVRNRWRG